MIRAEPEHARLSNKENLVFEACENRLARRLDYTTICLDYVLQSLLVRAWMRFNQSIQALVLNRVGNDNVIWKLYLLDQLLIRLWVTSYISPSKGHKCQFVRR